MEKLEEAHISWKDINTGVRIYFMKFEYQKEAFVLISGENIFVLPVEIHTA